MNTVWTTCWFWHNWEWEEVSKKVMWYNISDLLVLTEYRNLTQRTCTKCGKCEVILP